MALQSIDTTLDVVAHPTYSKGWYEGFRAALRGDPKPSPHPGDELGWTPSEVAHSAGYRAGTHHVLDSGHRAAAQYLHLYARRNAIPVSNLE